jgi:PAS domain S-box-containing protein
MIFKFPPLDPNAWLAAIVDSSDDAIVSKDLTGTITSWNSGATRIFGYTAEEMVGESILKLIPYDRHNEEVYILGMVRKGEHINHYNTIRRCKDGRMLHVSLTVSPIRNQDQEIIGVSKIARDITDWKRTQDTQTLLLRELNHRSKNLLAVADAIVRQTAKSTRPAELVNRVSRRLHALSINQDLLIERNWRGVDLSQIVRSQLAPLLDDVGSQVKIEGPPIEVSPAAAQALSMAVYELAANALRFGALSTLGGHIDVQWNIAEADGARQFKISWRESGGPLTSPPKKKGLGSTIIEKMVARSLQGSATINYAGTGIIWELVAPEAALLRSDGNIAD